MELLAEIFHGVIRKNSDKKQDNRSNYIFYKIIDAVREGEYTLQCINTNATFRAKLTDIVSDIDILYGLHPVQACYVGIEYSQHLKEFSIPEIVNHAHLHKLHTKYSTYRYGNYHLDYQNRQGKLYFTHQKTQETFIMDPLDIAFSEKLIKEFDTIQAFYIGLLAGRKMHRKTKQHAIFKRQQPQLRLIK